MVAERLEQLLELLLERVVVVDVLDLQQGQQRLVTLGVLLAAVLDLLGHLGRAPPHGRVDLLLLGLGVRDQQDG